MNIDILFVVTTSESAKYLEPLLSAANRASCTVAVFLTNDGVRLASASSMGAGIAAMEHTVVCADSWSRYLPDEQCPVTLGSQTDHSQLAGHARTIVGF